ncbi:MAG: signal recognition particle protein [Lachnospiraceae bacterium]|jgi:signal recognition particle subunit SRP54|nr:signal recognition particle protein [Lachnospiraceae bacterium]HAP33217.1 signal recognition particle protein [Lachnospiraceae bacterium]HBR04160.1 signal recognition particle protein [Lachnospiraceae bacterium]HBZ89555.1 signal recognition particle protein [Lachnospiraceae bacterium]
MAFEGLSEKLTNIFKNLRGKGKLSEADVKAALREVKMALLEADVSFKIVKQFVNSVQEKCVGEKVFESLTPAQTVIKIVNEQMVELMGSSVTELPIKAGNATTVLMMVGLQGAGKTTTAAKLAGKLKAQGKRPLLVACDIYRPAAIKQLEVNGEKQGVPVFAIGTDHKPAEIVEAAKAHAEENKNNVIIIDTAGRLQIDEAMMDELVDIKKVIDVDTTILTVDAMTGQEAVNVAEAFSEKVGIDGVILTKLDGDTRGGAALSIRAVTGKPIFYAGMGEKLSDLEPFYPDRMASRILGMGDVLTLIDKVSAEYDEKQARELEQKMKKAEFDFNDYLAQMQQMKKMGGINDIMKLLPGGMGIGAGDLSDDQIAEAENSMGRMEAIIYSMTPKERENPDIINVSRKKRIANGAGVDIAEVNKVMKQYEQSRKLMKQMSGMLGGGGKGKKKRFGLPGMKGMKFPF